MQVGAEAVGAASSTVFRTPKNLRLLDAGDAEASDGGAEVPDGCAEAPGAMLSGCFFHSEPKGTQADAATPERLKPTKAMAGKQFSAVSFGGQHAAVLCVDGGGGSPGGKRMRN